MLKLFIKAIRSIEPVYLCIGAVDEVLQKHQSEFLRALRRIIYDAPNARPNLTGRPYIRGEVDKHPTRGAGIIQIVADQGDIARYLSQKMDDDQDPDLMTKYLRNDILETILEKTSEMCVEETLKKMKSLIIPRGFLLVALNIEAILGETSARRRCFKRW